jgi:hypothetical protein
MRFLAIWSAAWAAAALSGCAGLDKPGLKTYEEIRSAIVVTTDSATGVVTASSELAAKQEIRISDVGVDSIDGSGLFGAPVNSQRRRESVFVQADRHPAGVTQVYIVHRRNYPISDTELQTRPWTETDPDRTGLVGEPWREVPWELVEFRYECPGSLLNCTRYSTNRLKLSSEDVRALLQENRDEIRMSFGNAKIVSWRLDADELLATLDAEGATNQFR